MAHHAQRPSVPGQHPPVLRFGSNRSNTKAFLHITPTRAHIRCSEMSRTLVPRVSFAIINLNSGWPKHEIGDGVTDDTNAIKYVFAIFALRQVSHVSSDSQAISSGSRCGMGTCGSSTWVRAYTLLMLTTEIFWDRITPAVVYFPSG
jgi:hypothetical protein